MFSLRKTPKIDLAFVTVMVFLVILSQLVLWSIANFLYPAYFLYLVIGILTFALIVQIDFDVIKLFSGHLYVISIALLIITLLIGQATRGAVRWIPLGPITIQPSEIVKPFLILFWANLVANNKKNIKNATILAVLSVVPLILILVQPALGMTMLAMFGLVGVLLASGLPWKYYLFGIASVIAALPIAYFLMQPYQRQRIESFLTPSSDPLGAGYNSIQSVISVGSGGFVGKGLGKGVQTQLSFLPERHTDFIFASVAEELGFLGAIIIVVCLFFLLYKIIIYLENSKSLTSRIFLTGVFLMLLIQIVINIGMNLGLLPITGLPLPLVSAGGSAFLGLMITFGLVQTARR